MRSIRILLIVLFLSLLIVPAPAADTGYEDMLKKAQDVNATVPQKGTAALGSQQSMTEMVDWLNACSSTLMRLINDVMNIFGLGSTDFSQKMTKTLEQGVQPPKGATGK